MERDRQRLGLTFDQLGRPDVVVTAISPFGDSGPYRDFLDGELVLLALGGLLNMVGAPDREPLRLDGFQAHYAAGLSAFTGTMAALWSRQVTGQGQEVEVASLETVACIEWKGAAFYQADGQVRRRQGDRGDQWLVVRCADGFAAFVYRDQDWPAIVQLAGSPDIADPRFATHEGRLAAFAELRRAIEGWTARHLKAHIYHAAQARGIPVGMVADVTDVLASPQNEATGFFAEIDHPITGPVRTPRLPFLFDGRRPALGRAPLLGEHTDELLRPLRSAA